MRLLFLLATFIFSGRLYALQIVAGPCLQSPTETSITMLWITDANCTSWVEYGTDESLGQKAISSRYGLIDANRKIHKITLNGLAAGTLYYYKVCSREIVKFDPYKVAYGENVSSSIYHFTTLDRKKEAISVIVLNDIHENKEKLTQLVEAAKEKPYDLVFLNGDTLRHFDRSQQLIVDCVVQPCTKSFATGIPLIYVRGNHDTRGEFARQLPEYFTLFDNQYYGSFDHGPIHFVVMDCGEDKEDSFEEYSGLADFEQYRNQQRLWLEKEIQSEAFQNASFRVVLMHIPVNAGPKIDFVWVHRQKWMPLFEKGKVDAMICGHTHQPEIVAPKPGEHSYPVIIGGGPLKMERPQSWDYTTTRVDGTPDRLTITMLGDDGKIIDSCTVEKRAMREKLSQ